MRTFPDGFLWGAATSSYQVEGSPAADGKGPSIWDTFTHEPGRIEGGGTGDVACDHYRRWPEDVELMGELGLGAYRLSIAWPRVFPTGRPPLERRGFDHYGRLIDALLERGIEPVVTLYHWELPQALEDEGGWLNRDTGERFAEFAAACFEAFGDRVRSWLTINEPWIIGLLGYLHGLHAPGYKDDVRGEATTFHHLLLAHGRAVQEFRGSGCDGRIGIALSLAPHYAASDSEEDAEVTWASDGYVNRWFLDPVFRGWYPEDMWGRYEGLIGPLAAVHDAIGRGVPVIGYCHWSLLDNFEWALGYDQRFGLVHVDYETQLRTIKDSGRYYARVVRANALVPAKVA